MGVAGHHVVGATLRDPTQDLQLPRIDETAETLLRRNPFALLLAILLDQGVPAERAFQAPQTLHERLGHLDPARMAADEPSVLRAMSARPMPHRFPAVGTRWIVRAATRVSDELDGDVRRLWADRPTARALQARLEAFDGIGQKTAAMAVEILARDFASRSTRNEREQCRGGRPRPPSIPADRPERKRLNRRHRERSA